ncbi:hypothetical protein PpBr36_09007 [Pyricularia pennisetigena]|uniref:hypothetical protein n=1 Tax=Pyricularia pennisetigena TaxID=1578925 RepID=UPI00114EEAA7|nr:hypothetical protein PpBr36_09007 [Pyricularia pennisetigena]TLS24688.1 hypothetical protein PpBr36_09007 [Pyricularia pennisetigena]
MRLAEIKRTLGRVLSPAGKLLPEHNKVESQQTGQVVLLLEANTADTPAGSRTGRND